MCPFDDVIMQLLLASPLPITKQSVKYHGWGTPLRREMYRCDFCDGFVLTFVTVSVRPRKMREYVAIISRYICVMPQTELILYCDKFHVRFIRLWCGVQSSWICIRCDGFVVRLKLMWRYHPDHVTVSSWHFQKYIVVRWRGFDGVYWWNRYIIWRFDKWCWSKNRWRRQLSWSWRC